MKLNKNTVSYVVSLDLKERVAFGAQRELPSTCAVEAASLRAAAAAEAADAAAACPSAAAPPMLPATPLAASVSPPTTPPVASLKRCTWRHPDRAPFSSWQNPCHDPASSLAYVLHMCTAPGTAECASEQAAQCRALTPWQQPGSQSPI